MSEVLTLIQKEGAGMLALLSGFFALCLFFVCMLKYNFLGWTLRRTNPGAIPAIPAVDSDPVVDAPKDYVERHELNAEMSGRRKEHVALVAALAEVSERLARLEGRKD